MWWLADRLNTMNYFFFLETNKTRFMNALKKLVVSEIIIIQIYVDNKKIGQSVGKKKYFPFVTHGEI